MKRNSNQGASVCVSHARSKATKFPKELPFVNESDPACPCFGIFSTFISIQRGFIQREITFPSSVARCLPFQAGQNICATKRPTCMPFTWWIGCPDDTETRVPNSAIAIIASHAAKTRDTRIFINEPSLLSPKGPFISRDPGRN